MDAAEQRATQEPELVGFRKVEPIYPLNRYSESLLLGESSLSPQTCPMTGKHCVVDCGLQRKVVLGMKAGSGTR